MKAASLVIGGHKCLSGMGYTWFKNSQWTRFNLIPGSLDEKDSPGGREREREKVKEKRPSWYFIKSRLETKLVPLTLPSISVSKFFFKARYVFPKWAKLQLIKQRWYWRENLSKLLLRSFTLSKFSRQVDALKRDILSVIKITYKWNKNLKYYQNIVAREEDEGPAATYIHTISICATRLAPISRR